MNPNYQQLLLSPITDVVESPGEGGLRQEGKAPFSPQECKEALPWSSAWASYLSCLLSGLSVHLAI